VKLRETLGPETLERCAGEITGKVVKVDTMELPTEQLPTYQRAFVPVLSLWQHGDLVAELVFSQHLARIVPTLLGVGSVRLYPDQAMYNKPAGEVTPPQPALI